jgi:hypothetical protein
MTKDSKVFILTIPSASFRIAQLEEELSKQGITNFEYVQGYDAEHVPLKPHTAIAMGHKLIVENNINEEYITIMEDDIQFTSPDSWKYYVESFESLPENWHIYLGGVYRPNVLGKVEGKFRWCQNYCGLHFYTIHKSFYTKFLSTPDDKHIDKYLYILGAASYLLHPIPSIQRGDYSIRQKRKVNYKPMERKLEFLK